MDIDEEVYVMSSLGEYLYRQAYEKSMVMNIKTISNKIKMTTEQVMDLLDIPEDERAKYEEMLKNSTESISNY